MTVLSLCYDERRVLTLELHPESHLLMSTVRLEAQLDARAAEHAVVGVVAAAYAPVLADVTGGVIAGAYAQPITTRLRGFQQEENAR